MQRLGGAPGAGKRDRAALEYPHDQEHPSEGHSEWRGWALEHGGIYELATERLQ